MPWAWATFPVLCLIFVLLCFVFGHTRATGDYPWLWSQESFLARQEEPYGKLGNETQLIICDTSSLLAVLLLWPNQCTYRDKNENKLYKWCMYKSRKSRCDYMRPSSCFLLKPIKWSQKEASFSHLNLTQMSRLKV